MPYLATAAKKSVTALSIKVELSVFPPELWEVDTVVTLKAKVTSNGNPLADRTVRFWLIARKTVAKLIGSATTDSEGIARLNWTVPFTIDGYTLPCYEHQVQAELYPEGVSSNVETVKVAYPTKISLSVPKTVIVGQYFTISGKLLYKSAKDTWSPLAGRTVNVYANDKLIKSVTTGSDGSFEVKHKFDAPGTYTIVANYLGEGLAARAAVLTARLLSPATSPLPQVIAGGLMLLAGVL